MPFEADGEQRRRGPRLEVRPSAVLELTWVLNLLQWHSEPTDIQELRDAAPELRAELTELWGDERETLAETSILAERIGALLTDEADTFLDGLERAARLDGAGLELRSESPQVRQATLDRLERLRSDPGLARRHARLLARIWSLVRPDWEQEGRERVSRACREWTARLDQGASVADLFRGRHLVRRTDQQELLTLRDRVVLSPMHFARVGGFVVDMTSFVHVGGPARPEDVDNVRREESEQIATMMKVLSDG